MTAQNKSSEYMEKSEINALTAGLLKVDREFIQNVLPELSERLSTSRYAHSISVAHTARKLANIYDVDLSMSVRAGLLHDWDKCYKGQAVFNRMVELGLELPKNYEQLSPIFHAITGAKALSIRFPQLEPQVLQAVARHTSGDVDMQPLDMIVYVADMIEPLRKYESLHTLQDLVGKLCLSDLFSECCMSTVKTLVESGRSMHPDTALVWNSWVVPYLMRKRDEKLS